VYSTRTAYLLWVGSWFLPGLHRFYLGKVGTGLLYFFTGGLFTLGTIYDGLTMQSQVREANLRLRMQGMLDDELDEASELDYRRERPLPLTGRSRPSAESPENLTTDAASEQLDALVNKGIGELRVRKNGSLVYVFPDFLNDQGTAELEQY